MSNRPKFDPSAVATLLSRGAEEGRAVFPSAAPAAPALASVPSPSSAASSPSSADVEAGDDQALEAAKRPLTIRLSEEVLHALLRHQATVRCQPGVRLGPTTIGGIVDTLLRGPLGLRSES